MKVIYSIIETDAANAETGKLVGLRISTKAAIELAKKHHKKTGKRIMVASRTNLRRTIFEIAAKKKLPDLKAILKEYDERKEKRTR